MRFINRQRDQRRLPTTAVGQVDATLPPKPDAAAEAFLSQLVAAGYAAFEPEGSVENTEKPDKKED